MSESKKRKKTDGLQETESWECFRKEAYAAKYKGITKSVSSDDTFQDRRDKQYDNS